MADSVHTETEPEFPRTYVAVDAVFDRWEAAADYYRELTERGIGSVEELERWLMDWSELDACFSQEGTSRRVAMTRQTDDTEIEKRHLHFVENVKPKREPWHDKLLRAFVRHAAGLALPKVRYEVLERSARNAIDIYREENVALLTEDEKLSQQYQKLTGAMTVEFDGREQTLQQLGRYLQERDREVRERAWRAAGDRFLDDKDRLNQLYRDMVQLRHRIARHADCSDFREYTFKRYERFDYTPDDCLKFHEAIESVVLPAVGKLAEDRKARLELDTLRPWDLDADPDGREPLRPFETVQELSDGCARVFNHVTPDFGQIYHTLADNDALDLGNRKGKAPGGYQATFNERRMPFIFMNAVGTDRDVKTLLHEGGHAFHTWACRNEPLLPYRGCPIEFAEVASIGMECLSHPFLGELYGDDADRARKAHLTSLINFLPWMARVDAFQHYVYTHVDEPLDAWLDEWQALRRRFAPHQDWSGLETPERHSWHRKLHFFEVPFYYVEYGIAQLGALQIWLNSRKDYQQAVAMYRAGLALGGSRPLPELFETAGCKFDFSEAILRPLIDEAMAEIERL